MGDDKELITILSIDGGGIRGLIPAIILAFLEQELQVLDGDNARIADYFDVIAGTSTGGIMAAMLVTPANKDSNRPAPASTLEEFYCNEGPKIFSEEAKQIKQLVSKRGKPSDGWFMKAFNTAVNAGSYFFAKALFSVYDGVYLREKSEEILGDILLANTMPTLVIPAYDVQNLRPVIFSSHQAKKENSDVRLADVVTSTTAAPYYFPPNKIKANGIDYTLVDGGLAANNPTLLAIHEAEKMLADDKANTSNSRCESVYGNLLILSLGTGAAEPQPGNRIDTGTPLEWLIDFVYQSSPLVDVMMRASDSMVETYTTSLLQTYNSQDNYLRIQDDTMKMTDIKMDDASQDNLDRLKKIAKSLLERSVSKVTQKTGMLLQVQPNKETTQHNPVPIPGQKNQDALRDFAKKLSHQRRLKSSPIPVKDLRPVIIPLSP